MGDKYGALQNTELQVFQFDYSQKVPEDGKTLMSQEAGVMCIEDYSKTVLDQMQAVLGR